MSEHQLSLLLVAAVAVAAPLLFAAIGELVSEVGGVINIELEGMMLCGAFLAVLGAHLSHSLLVGFLLGALGGVALAALHGVVCLVFDANQVVSGVVLNILALGVTSFGLSVAFGVDEHVSVATLGPLRIPGLVGLPLVGGALFGQPAPVYLAFLLVPFAWWFLNRTAAGLRVQAAGEQAQAAESLGVGVLRTRWAALLACGALAGIGGAQLTLAGVGAFTENITAGRGFVALAAVVFGRWRPLGTLVAVLIFALGEAFAVRAQSFGVHIPNQLLLTLPYVLTLVALTGLVRPMRPPAQLGVNFERQ